jgi:dynein heavy chain
MPTLDALIELIPKINESKFRIWMTAMPCDHIPVNILQNSVKLTIEPPKGLKNNIMNSYAIMNEKEFDGFEKEKPFKCLMWGLCFFNAMILERRKYGPLGWNIPYQFSNSDLLISQAQLQDFLLNYDEIPWVALKYMVSEANYGGRVTDPNDRTTINLILEDFYNPDMLKTKHKLSESGVYYVPEVGDLQSYKDFISSDDMPINDLTEIFGLHENAEITSAINTTNEMLAMAMTLISSGGSAGGGDGKTPEQIINETANEILDKLPLNFDMEYASKKHKLCYEDSMNTVLQQELLRYNQLLGVVRTSLINVGKAIKGEVPMSPELEDVTESLFHNTIPAVWDKVSYPSLKPLASYIADFLERLKFMQSWIDNGAPTNFWISGFFFTQSFLTGAKQNYARKYVIAIDHIDFDFTVISDESKYDLANGPEDGVFIFGLYVEGARWDDSMEAIEESNPKVLFTQMRPVWILPKEMKSIDYGHSFKCPVYKTARRAGTLSTTGHSTNFVCYIYLPIQEKHEDSHWIKRGVAMLTQLSD